MVIVGGSSGGRGAEVNSFHCSCSTPRTARITPLVETKVPRHDHSTVALLADGSVLILGGNATRSGADGRSRALPMRACRTRRSTSRPTSSAGAAGDRGGARQAPATASVSGSSSRTRARSEVGSVVLQRIGPVTHNWDWGNRHVKLWFEEHEENGSTSARPPRPGWRCPATICCSS